LRFWLRISALFMVVLYHAMQKLMGRLISSDRLLEIHDVFIGEFDQLPEAIQNGLVAHAGLLEHFGPSLGRPRVVTLKG
jgi:hypothetical protein